MSIPPLTPFRSASLACLGLAVLLPAVARTWTNRDGVKIEAEILGATATTVSISMEGRRFEVSLATLSEEDRQFVARWLEENPEGGAPAPRPHPHGGAPAPGGTWDDPQPYGPGGLPFSPTARRTLPLSADLPEEFPRPAAIEVEIVEENRDAGQFIYQTEHFHYTADQRLTGRVMEGLAEMFESTYLAVEVMPWGIPIIEPRTDDGRILVELYLDEDAYHKAGGVPGSAGVASGERFLCLLSQIGVRDTGRRLILESLENSTVLTHEMTHVLRHSGDSGLPVWAVEGFAQFMETYPWSDRGVYEFDDPLELSLDGATRLEFPVSLEEFLVESPAQFYDGGIGHGSGLGAKAHLHYAAAKVLMTYLWCADQPKGDERPGEPIRAYLEAIYRGDTPEEAREKLLAGRSWEEFTEAVIDGMSRYATLEIPVSGSDGGDGRADDEEREQ